MSAGDKYRKKINKNFGGKANDYTSLSGGALLSNRQAVRDVRDYYNAKGETFSNTQEMWDRFYKDRRWRDSNTFSMGKGMIDYALAGDGQALEARLSKLWANAPSRGSTWEKIKQYGTAGALDPINVAGMFGTAAKGAKAYQATRAAMGTNKQALKAAGRAGGKQGAITEGIISGGVGGAFDAATQAAEIQQGVTDEIDLGRVARSAGLEATAGSLFGYGFGNLSGRKGAKDALQNALPASRLGSTSLSRASDLDRQITSLQEDIADTDNVVDRADLEDQLFSLEQEKRNVGSIRGRAAELEQELEAIAGEAEARRKDNPNASVSDLEERFRAASEQRNTLLATDYENIDYDAIGVKKEERERQKTVAPAVSTETGAKAGGELTDTGTQKGSTDATTSKVPDETDAEAAAKEKSALDVEQDLAAKVQEAEANLAQAKVDAGLGTEADAKAVAAKAVEKPQEQPKAEVVLTDAEKAVLDLAKGGDPKGVKINYKRGKTLKDGEKPSRQNSIEDILKKNKEFISVDDVKRLISQGQGITGVREKFVSQDMQVILRSLVRARKAEAGLSVTKETKGAVEAPDAAKATSQEAKEDVVADATADVAATNPNSESAAQLARAEQLFQAAVKRTATLQNPLKGMKTDIKRAVKSGEDKVVVAAFRKMVNMSGEVFAEAEKVANNVKYAEVRQDFLARKAANDGQIQGTLEANTNPDKAASQQTIKFGDNASLTLNNDARTVARSADRTAKASEALESGPVTTGKSIETIFDVKTGERIVRATKDQAIIRRGYATGSEGGYSVLSIADVPNKKLFPLDEAKARANMDIAQGKGKAFDCYKFVATGMEQVCDLPRVNRKWGKATEGDVLLYVPFGEGKGRVFANIRNAEKALGIDSPNADGKRFNDQAEGDRIYDNVSADGEFLPIESVEEFNRLKQEAADQFEKDGDVARFDKAQSDIEARSGKEAAPEVEPETDNSVLKDLPVKQGNKVLAFVPKDPNNGRILVVGTYRGVDGNNVPQVDRADTTAETVFGKRKKASDYNIGYIDRALTDNNDEFKALKSNRKAFMEVFEDMNAEAPEPELITPPNDLYEIGSGKQFDMSADAPLTDGQYNALMTAWKIFLPDFDRNKAPKSMSLDMLNSMITTMEDMPWEFRFKSGDVLPAGVRANTIGFLKEIVADQAPSGIKRPTVEIEESVKQLRDVFSNQSAATMIDMERILRLVAPANKAPIFTSLDDGMAQFNASPQNLKGDVGVWNDIGLNADQFRTEKMVDQSGLTPTFTLSHELGHWAYKNLMSEKEQHQFWKIASKYYDDNGEFTTASAKELYKKSPIIGTFSNDGSFKAQRGARNGLDTPAEFFANQFALYLHNKHEALIVKDATLWGKITKIVQSLWKKMTSSETIDPDMVPLFDKLITNKKEAQYSKWIMPVDEATTKLGSTYQTRYAQWLESYKAIRIAASDGDIDNFMGHLSDLAASIDGSTRTVNQAKAAARGKKEEYRGYSGPLRALSIENGKGDYNKLRAVLRKIRTMQASATKTEFVDEMPMTSYDQAIGQELMGYALGEEFTQSISKSLDKMNDWFLTAEGGDIPGYVASQDVIDLRRAKGGVGAVKRDKAYVKMMKQNAAARSRNKNQTVKMMQSTGDKTDAASDLKVKDVDFNPREVSMEFAVSEYPKHIDAKGVPNKVGKALAKRAFNLSQTEMVPVDPPKRADGKLADRSFSSLTPYELLLRYNTAIDNGSEDTARKLIYEMQQRKQFGGTKTPKVAPTSQKVIAAIETEKRMNYGFGEDNGLPSEAMFKLRKVLSRMKNRNPKLTNATRTAAERLIYLGHEFSSDTKSPSFIEFRNEARRIAANVSKKDDVTDSIRAIGRMLMSSQLLDQGQIDTIRRGANSFNYNADEFILRILSDDLDGNSDKSFLKETMEMVGDNLGAELNDAIQGVRRDAREGVSYVLNGLLSKKARKRFYNIASYGDMFEEGSSFNPASPLHRFSGEVPSDFAADYANDAIGAMSPSTRQVVQFFTGEQNPRVHYVNSLQGDNLFGNAIRVSRRPSGGTVARQNDIVQSVPEDRQGYASSLANELANVRESIRNMRFRGTALAGSIENQYNMERALVKEIESIGGSDPTNVRVVFLRDTDPVELNYPMTITTPIVERLKDAIRATETDIGIPSRVDKAFSNMSGYYSGREIFDALETAAGGATNLRTAMRKAGFSSLEVMGEKSMLNPSDIKDIRSPDLKDKKMDIGTKPAVSDPIAYTVDAMVNDTDLGEMAFAQTSQNLEMAGVPAKMVDALDKVRNGGKVSEDEGRVIRSTAKWTLTRTNAAVMNKNGMAHAAEFFEPSNGAGGHFERVNAKMGNFLMPFQRLLREMPDSGNFMSRWANDGLMQMFEATPGSGKLKGALGFDHSKRTLQPNSHRMISTALRDQDQVKYLTTEERKAYSAARSYLDKAIVRLKDAGIMVGEVKKNYFPQVWRKDLITANREGFVDVLSRYFQREHEVRDGSRLPTREANKIANRVADRLIASDGVMTGDPALFRKMGSMAGKDDHTDFQRLIRLDRDEFKEFKDATRPYNNLSQFLENDLMVVMTKYSDNLEHRLDITDKFGTSGHGFHDYIATLSGGGDAISRLLSSRLVLKREYKTYLQNGEGDDGMASRMMTLNALHPPFPNQEAANTKTKELIDLAQSGASRAELKSVIMDLVETSGETSEGAARMRKNFQHRADGIAAALYETEGFQKPIGDDSLRHAEGMMNATLRKPIDGADGLYNLKGASKVLRSINAVTLLSFTTLTSMGDLILPLIRSGDFASYSRAISKFTQDPVSGSAYRDMIRNIGAATENVVHDRMTKAFGVDNTQFTSGFFTATLLTPWTDAMRDISASVAFEHFKAQQRIALDNPNTRQGRLAKRQLDGYGLQKLYQRSDLDMDMIVGSNNTGDPHPEYHDISTAIHKFANQTIFTPNANDIPLWAQTPMGAIIMQLKSFPLMMTRLGRDVVQKARKNEDGDRNLMPLLYFAGAGPAFGAVATGVKDIVQGRGGEDNQEFALRDRAVKADNPIWNKMGIEDDNLMLGWYIDGLMTFGGLGLIGQLFYDSAAQLDNGAYGKWRSFELLAGPSLGLFSDGFDVGSGLMEMATDAFGMESTNAKERQMVRETIGRAPVLGQITSVREALVDRLAGESEN